MFSDNLNKTIKLKERGLKLIFWLSNLTILLFCPLGFLAPKKELANELTLPILIIVGFLIAITNFFIYKFAGSHRCLKLIYDKTVIKGECSEEEKKEKRLINVLNNYSQSLSVNAGLNATAAVFGLVLALYASAPIPASYALWAYGIILNCYMWPKLGRTLEKFANKLG